ncbi:MAG: substrate-binding domain-containing protein [Phycisphaerae bacterium]
MDISGHCDGSRRIALLLDADREYARSNIRGIQRARLEYATSQGEPPGAWEFRLFRRQVGPGEDQHIAKLLEWAPHGVLIEAGNVAEIETLNKLGCPYIRLGYELGAEASPTITTDEKAVGEMAARHLIDIGLENFAFYHQYHTPWTQCRLDGFGRLLQPRKVHVCPAPKATFLPGRDFPLSARATLIDWMRSLPLPVGIFAACDDWGIRVIECAHACKLRVPEDVAVLGVDDDYLMCNMVIPALSSVRQAGEQVGRTAFQMLREVILGQPITTTKATIRPLSVTARASTDVIHVGDPAVRAAILYIRAHRDENFGVKQLLPHVGLNRRSLEIRFRRVCGRTLGEEIRRARMERVKALLRSDMKIDQIAHAMHFTSGGHLARTFRREIGVSPSQYRREIGENNG